MACNSYSLNVWFWVFSFVFIKPTEGRQDYPPVKFQRPVASHGGTEHFTKDHKLIFLLELFGNVHLEVTATASPVIVCCTHTEVIFSKLKMIDSQQTQNAVLPYSLLCAHEFRISGYTVMGKQTNTEATVHPSVFACL